MRTSSLIGMLVLATSSTLFFARGCSLTLATSGQLPPFYQYTESGWQGFSIHWLNQISSFLGCEAKLVDLPWPRALSQLKAGQIDLMTNLSKTAEREPDVDFIGPVSMENMVLLLEKDAPELTELSQIPSLQGQIAVVTNVFYGDEFKRLNESAEFQSHLVKTQSSLKLKQLLISKRVLGIIEDLQVLQQWHQAGLLDLNQYQPVKMVHQSPIYIGLSKKSLRDGQRQRIRAWWQQYAADLAKVSHSYSP